MGNVPVGYPRTEAGAKAAAANFTIVSGAAEFLTNGEARHRAVAMMASASSIGSATDRADREAAQAANELGGGNAKPDPSKVIARTGVLSARTLGLDIHRAMIRLWTTVVRGNVGGNRAPVASFRSVTVSLVWENEDWKLSGTSDTSGLVAPTDYRQTTNLAGDFTDYVPGKADDAVLSGATGSNGFPAPYSRSEQGARAAATSAAMLYGNPQFFANTAWRHRMLAAITAPEILSAVTADTDSTAETVVRNQGLNSDGKTADGGLLVTRTAVLGARAVSYSDQTASIELWTASVGGIAGGNETARPQIGYRLMTIDLTWSGETWKTTTVAPGMSLVPAPPTTDEASSAGSFTEVGGPGNASSTA